jgi:hypothetical protein
MSALVSTVAPVVNVTPVVVTHTVTVFQGSHWFQLAEIVKYVTLGAGLSIIHSVVNNKYGLPKWLNKVLPVVYAGVAGIAIVAVDNAVNWNDWFQVFTQVVAGAVGVYALVTLVTPTSTAPVVATPETDLPTVPTA